MKTLNVRPKRARKQYTASSDEESEGTPTKRDRFSAGWLPLNIVLASIILPLFAASAHATTQWYAGVVELVHPLNDGSFVVAVATVLPTCSSSGSGAYLTVSSGQNAVTLDGAKNMLAAVLTAFATGHTAEIAYDDSSSYCYVNRLLIQ